MYYKSGFVNIIGNSNVGKSSLINRIIGKKISIISSKVQTTKDRILGILNKKNLQIIFSDTPGIILENSLIQKKMMYLVKEAIHDADLILYVTDIYDKNINNIFINYQIQNSNIPLIIVINKIDKLDNPTYKIDQISKFWQKNFPKAIEIFPISILNNLNIDILLNKISYFIPKHPPYYPNNLFTNKSKKFFVNEIIREQIFASYNQELPYIIEISTEIFKEYLTFIYIYSILYIHNINQKNILIGYQGKKIKKVHISSIANMKIFFCKNIKLKLQIKLKKS